VTGEVRFIRRQQPLQIDLDSYLVSRCPTIVDFIVSFLRDDVAPRGPAERLHSHTAGGRAILVAPLDTSAADQGLLQRDDDRFPWQLIWSGTLLR
jgi:hypothetical protein